MKSLAELGLNRMYREISTAADAAKEKTMDRDRVAGTLSAGANCEKSAQREKTWDECGIEEKVERIRRELRNQRDLATYGARNASEALELARTHQHGARGEVLKPADDHRNGLSASIEGRYDPLR